MKRTPPNASPFLFAFVSFCLLFELFAPRVAARSAQDADKNVWTRVRSENFTLVGDASARETSRVAVSLERFRRALAHLLGGDPAHVSTLPTTVIVFKSYASYGPFRSGDASGYFQPGEGTNYITLTTERLRGAYDPYAVAFHEYVHLLFKERFPGAPLWMSEGLAEFYSTLETDGERSVRVGSPVRHHLRTLRERTLIPLSTLLTADHDSLHYRERGGRRLFYAQSWALTHYLMRGSSDVRRAQFQRLLELLSKGRAGERAVREAFGDDLSGLETELDTYVARGSYAAQSFELEESLNPGARVTESEEISESDWTATLGDLLLNTQREEEAEEHLRRAIALDARNAEALTSLALLHVRQGRLAEARRELQKALECPSPGPRAHYYLAYVISYDPEARTSSGGLTPESVARMRSTLRRAVELAPEYADAHELLAHAELAAGNLEEAQILLKRAQSLAPSRAEKYALTLAHVHTERGEYLSARRLAEPLAQRSASETIRRNASELLKTVRLREELEARRRSYARAFGESDAETSSRNGAREESSKEKSESEGEVEDEAAENFFHEPFEASRVRAKGEGQEQARGELLEVECSKDGGVLLRLSAGERVLTFRASNFERVPFVSHDPSMAFGRNRRLTCGPRTAANHILLTYRPLSENPHKADGEIVAVDFIPRDWR